MHKLDATLTLALPVNAAQLAAHLQAYTDTLPALNALRACNRFGKGPQCHINKLPIELVQSIARYYILPVREKHAALCTSQLHCYEESCLLFDDDVKENLLEAHDDMVRNSPVPCQCVDPYNPRDEELSACLGEHGYHHDEHDTNRYRWAQRAESLANKRALFRKHFGLDVWLSTVCLGSSERLYNEAETTIVCLTLPDREQRSEQWEHFESEDASYEYGRPDCKSGCSMAVMMEPRAGPEEVQRFKRAMKVLELEVFLHESQRNKKPLSLALNTADSAPVVDDTAASYPRPMFLVRTLASDW